MYDYLSATIPRKGVPNNTPAVKTDIASYLNITIKLFQQKWHLYITSPWCFRSQTRSHSDTMLGSSPFSNLNSNRVQEFLSEYLKPLTRAPSRQFFPQKFWVNSESTPVFLSKNLSLERKIATNLNSWQKYALRTNIDFSKKCIYLQLKPI